MNNDYLRVNSKTEEEGIVQESYCKNDEPEIAEKRKITLFSLFKSASVSEKGVVEALPDLKRILPLSGVILLTAAALIAIAAISSNVIILEISSVFSSLVFPVLSLLLFYEMNTYKNVRATEIVGGIAVGAVCCIVVQFFTGTLVGHFLTVRAAGEAVVAAVNDVALFGVAYCYTKILKKANLFASALLAVCVYCGFSFAGSLTGLLKSTFIGTKIGEDGGTVMAAVLGEAGFEKIFTSFLHALWREALLMPAFYLAWSAVCGVVIGLTACPVRTGKYRDASVFMLVLIQIVLHAILSFGSSITAIYILLNAACLFASVFLAVRVLNYALSEAKF